MDGGKIEMGWLRDTFLDPDDDSTEVERIRYAWAYILQIIGGYLMPDLSRSRVHLRWLLKLVDFRAAGELSWGSAALATLYREMCGATLPTKVKIRRCLSLLQSWAWFRFPFLRPRVDHPYTFPLITRWNHPASYARLPTSLEDIRLLLDQQSKAQFQWTPYEDPTIQTVIPDEFLQNPNAWHAKVALISYATVEMHQSDRVLRQFGCRQPIPVALEVFDDHNKIDL
ncbi:protein MAIN-LIKE 1-like [Gossypium raimondii]|uniref:protein MAIN-LIKE 1-like n=1 Tax=Gossypium raimondii TaxID=29730 RepID=UPI00227AFCE3|nr:protein MAIN-LIKE 1-like [Gossypium raimondii]